MKRILLTCFMLTAMLVSVTAYAQDRTVTGRVTGADDGLPLPQVTVLLKGTATGVPTDADGNFRISVPANGAVLVFRYLGYVTQEVEVGNLSQINVQLQPDVTSLGEVVVTGYGTTTEERASISATTISAETIQSRPNASFVQTLTGQVAGLSIFTNSGQPGANSTVNLRGISSINGDTEPLFVIDGAPVNQDNFRSLNPNEIESISVLKDAGATAIYGNRGANGVIVVTTKRGGFDTGLTVNYTSIFSWNELQDIDYDLMGAQEQLTLERSRNAGRGAGLTDAEIAATGEQDWVDFFFDQGFTQNHNLTFTGGGANQNFFLSLGYFDQEGVLQSSSLQRFNIRSNVSGKSVDDKFNYSLNLSLNFSDSEEPNSIGSGAINRNYVLGAYQSVPYITPDEYVDGAALLSPLSFANTPLFLLDRLLTYQRTEDEFKLVSSASASYEILPGLVARTQLSTDFEVETLTRAEGPTSFNALLFAETGNNTPGFQQQQFTRRFLFNQVNSISYAKKFGTKHSVNFSVFSEYFKAHFNGFGFFQEGLIASTFAPGDGSAFVADVAANDFFVDNVNANILTAGLFSYFAQADWDYDGRFGLVVTGRRDASSRFATSNRWATFYSVAGRWNLHKEQFLAGTPFDILKLRASFGTNGNQDITGQGNFSGLALTENLFATAGGYGGAASLFLGTLGNDDLRWETVEQFNVGVDFELLDRRLRGAFDFYVKTTEDLFQSQPVSAITSVNALNANFGSMRNTGFDWELHYDLFRSEFSGGLDVTLNFIGNYNKNEILEFPGGETERIGVGRVGGPIFEYFSFRYAGVNPATGNLLFLTADDQLTENPNVDTDRVWLDKNVLPDFTGSFGFDIDYKGFFLTAQFNYTIGRYRFDGDYAGFINPNNIGQFRHSRDILRAWTPENRITDIPSLDANNLDRAGTRFLRDADYITLRFAQFGYNFPVEWLENVGLSSARLFVNGENLFNITEWRGFDVQAQTNGTRLYPVPRIISLGLELGLR